MAQGKRERDYAYLDHCSINASNQRWQIKGGSFYSVDGFYSLKDDGDILYAANFIDKQYNTHILDNDMKEWSQTKATPAGLHLTMYLQWEAGGAKYYISGRTSSAAPTLFYYDIENGHIASYNPLVPEINCMHSDVGTYDWNWTWWAKCSDDKAPRINLAYFKPILIGNSKIALRDRTGNYLRVTRYGPSCGQPYAARLEYLLKDSANSPTSEFFVYKSLQDWLRFISGNEGDNLPFCPAPGSLDNRTPLVRNSGYLSLNTPNVGQIPPIDIEVWEPRLLSIISSTTPRTPAVGVCGMCMLQAYQIIAEILEDPFHPRANGGYFFDTAHGVDPFISFRARNSLLFDTFSEIEEYYSLPVRTEADIFTNSVNLGFATSISLLPQYNWTMVGQSQTSGGIDEVLASVFRDPPGTIYLAMLSRRVPGAGETGGHASVVIRTNSGASIIPTNVPRIDLRDLRIYMQNTTNAQQLRHMLVDMGSVAANIESVALLRVSEVYHNPFSYAISFNNCTDFGNNRRGNAMVSSSGGGKSMR